MDLTTNYLGLKLANPLMPGASSLVDNLDTVRQLEDAGASAITMRSLFEEQIIQDVAAEEYHRDAYEESIAESLSFLPEPDFSLGPDEYLEQIRKIKEAVSVPVIGSLNGIRKGAWIEYSKLIAEAGADALELNMYFLPTDANETSQDVERRVLETVAAVREAVSIPVAVKLSPYFSSLPNFARQLDALKVDGLVLFNRFYQPDIDIEELEASAKLELSTSSELLLRLRWLGILFGNVKSSLCVTGGVHTVEDVIKSIMAGASGVQLVSALYMKGPGHLAKLLKELSEWLEEKEYGSLQEMIGTMSLRTCPNPEAFERANYVKIIQSWKP